LLVLLDYRWSTKSSYERDSSNIVGADGGGEGLQVCIMEYEVDMRDRVKTESVLVLLLLLLLLHLASLVYVTLSCKT
jgi:hypothetical protein